MRDTTNGLPIPRHVLEDSEARGEALGHLAKAADLLTALKARTALRGYTPRNDTLVTGYLTALDAVERMQAHIVALDTYDSDTWRIDAQVIVDSGSCRCSKHAWSPDCPVHPRVGVAL